MATKTQSSSAAFSLLSSSSSRMIGAASPTKSQLSATDFSSALQMIFSTSASNTPDTLSETAVPSSTTTADASGFLDSASVSNAAASSSASMYHRNLTIILSTVLPGVTIGIIVTVLLVRCFRRNRLGLSWNTKRGVTPIDDDEIATWRGDTQPMAQTPQHHRKSSSIVFTPASDLHYSPYLGPFPPRSAEGAPASPPIARAPNARCGLTDEAIPGAQPFIQQSRRQSSKLSKRQMPGHGRNGSFPGAETIGAGLVFDVDPEMIQKHVGEGPKGSRKSSFTRPSISAGTGSSEREAEPMARPSRPSRSPAPDIYHGYDKEMRG